MKVDLTHEELAKITDALEYHPDNELLSKMQSYQQMSNESINEEHQILDKVKLDNERGYITGEIDGKMIVMVQGNTYLVDPKDIKEYNKKPEIITQPHMKFDEKTQALLFEQYVKCGVYSGNVPVRLNDCFVRYNQWEKANPDQQIRVLVEGSSVFIPKSQIKILEDLNTFANPDNYVPGVLVDEATGEAIENILVDAVDYTNAVGDADAVKIIVQTMSGEQEMQTAPKAKVKTLAV